jgi:TonB family protein
VARLTGEAQILRDRGELDQARAKALKALDCDAEDPEAIDIAKKMNQAVERRDRLQTLISQGESLIAEGQFAEAAALIEPATAEFSGERLLLDLLDRARGGLERVRVINGAVERCKQLCQEHRFEQAREALERGLAVAPGDRALLILREKVGAQEQSYKRAASIREALEAVEWLMEQDRPDLAVRFLKEWCGGISNEPELVLRLNDLEKRLPDWEQRRFLEIVQEFSSRRGRSVVLPVLEEALKAGTSGYGAAERLRNALREQAIVTQVRQYLAAGNIGQADQVLQEGLAFLGMETSVSVKEEIEAYKKYAGERREAETLMARRQFREAEQHLHRLEGLNRPEIQELLELVRTLQEASDEKVFHARVKETALLLAGQGRLDEAERLFRKLSMLFPGDDLLEQERAAARAGGGGGGGVQKDEGRAGETRPVREPWTVPALPASRRSAVPKAAVIAALLILTAAGSALWRWSRSPDLNAAAPAAALSQERQRVGQSATQAVAAAAPVENVKLAPQEARLSSRIVVSTNTVGSVSRRKNSREAEPVTRRAFNAPVARMSGADRTQGVDLPVPPTPSTSPEREAPSTLAIGQGLGSVPPAPPKPAIAEKAALPPHRGVVEPARLISAPVPRFPMLAAYNHVSGAVAVDAVVDKQGRIKEVTAIRGNPLLTETARNAVVQWRYQPATIDGEPVEAKVAITVRFDGAQK